jgi:hypothetical protein
LLGVETDIGFAGGEKSAPAIPGTAGIFVPNVLALNDSMSMRKPWDMSFRARWPNDHAVRAVVWHG